MAALIWFLPDKNYYISYMMTHFQERLVTLAYIDLGLSSVIPYTGIFITLTQESLIIVASSIYFLPRIDPHMNFKMAYR